MSYIIELTFYFQFSNILLQENLLLPLKKPQNPKTPHFWNLIIKKDF